MLVASSSANNSAMKLFLGIFLLTLVLSAIQAQNNNQRTCPSPQSNPECRSASPLADLICYLPTPAVGLNYAFIGFGQGINAICSINYQCEPGISSQIDIERVYGFIVELPYLIRRSNTTRRASKLWFIDVSRGSGCPRVVVVVDSTFSVTAADAAIYPVPIPADLSFLIFEQSRRRYMGECNVFQAVEKVGCSCPYGSACEDKPPIVSVSLSQAESLLLYVNPGSIRTVAELYIDVYGIQGVNCTQSPKSEAGSDPPLYSEFCSVFGHNDTSLYCQDYRNTIQLRQIVESYGFEERLECLDSNKACTVSKLYAQGYNTRCGKKCSKSSCNDDSTTSFCTIAIIPQLSLFTVRTISRTELKDGPTFIYLEGFCENVIKTKIMKYFLDIC